MISIEEYNSLKKVNIRLMEIIDDLENRLRERTDDNEQLMEKVTTQRRDK